MPAYTVNRTLVLATFHREGWLTCIDQAAHVGLSRQTLTNVLSGRTKPHSETVAKLVRATGLSYADILTVPPSKGADAA